VDECVYVHLSLYLLVCLCICLSLLSQALRDIHLGNMFSLIKLRRVFTVHQVPKVSFI